MVKLINRDTGTEMWVDESRVAEYRAAGHMPAAPAPAPAKEPEEKPQAVPAAKPVKPVAKKPARKKG